MTAPSTQDILILLLPFSNPPFYSHPPPLLLSTQEYIVLSFFIIFFFFNFVLHLSQCDCWCLTLAKVLLLRLSQNSIFLMLSFCYHLTSQLRKFWVKCYFCFICSLPFMIYSTQRERHQNPLQVSV